MVKLLAWITPWSKYLWGILILISFASGAYITRMHYTAQITEIRAEYNRNLLQYVNRTIEKDSQYRSDLKSIQTQLSIIQGKVNEETKKPEYNCPIPSDGVGLLNNAIRATGTAKPSK